jgi:hypothetical protein
VRRPAQFSRVWWQERGLSAMLGLLVFALFVALPLEVQGVVSPLVISVAMTLLLLSGVVAISGRRRVTIAVAIVAVVSLALRWAFYAWPGARLANLQSAVGMLALGLLTALLLRHVFREGPITSDRIQGAVAVYLLLGLIWAEGYQLIDALLPGSFRFALERDAAGSFLKQYFAYFSFITLTTVGYGDITPIHPIARTAVIGEALVGQLYPAILIGRLVSLQISARAQGGQK